MTYQYVSFSRLQIFFILLFFISKPKVAVTLLLNNFLFLRDNKLDQVNTLDPWMRFLALDPAKTITSRK